MFTFVSDIVVETLAELLHLNLKFVCLGRSYPLPLLTSLVRLGYDGVKCQRRTAESAATLTTGGWGDEAVDDESNSTAWRDARAFVAWQAGAELELNDCRSTTGWRQPSVQAAAKRSWPRRTDALVW